MHNHNNMGFISSGVFWGAIIILFGISILLKEIFHIHIPLSRVLFGIVLLYLGIRMIAGGFGKSSSQHTIFGSTQTEYRSGQKEYNIIFGSGNIDLSKMNSLIQNEKIEINCIFGNGIVKINDRLPLKIEGSAAFGNLVMPDKNSSGFGEASYYSPSYQENQPHLTIVGNAVFGKLIVERAAW